MAALGLPDTTDGRRQFVERLDRRVVAGRMARAGVPALDAEMDAWCSHLRQGWSSGSQKFGQQMLKLGEKLLRKNRHRSYQASRERKAHGEQEAMEILKEGLAACGLMEKELKALPGSDVRKVAIAVKIWENTTMSMSWISENLGMKSAANASEQIRRQRAGKKLK
jgi:hypothetical protein